MCCLEYFRQHSSMLNVTARLAVKITNLPDWNVDWDDNTPQCSRSCLDSSHFLPSIEDADALNEAAVKYRMDFLVNEFDCLGELRPLIPTAHSAHL